ncbi:right-handed parallel beta-helix repeat-containing protein [Halorubrum sp. 48-1-W]|uniref:right-handed parallel beta-helix repeat-containing protein n=1 Tax=Halorubrum sp. 48-1-W TaxID=2249761 RepID=UPI0018E569B5|nr:right-handed parallel beta-helix repeat-containing protein [Halorubrum sp. 48-1-W]
MFGTSIIGLSSSSSTAVAEPTEIDECTTLSDGEYVLTEDISITGGCFSIDSYSDVTLDGDGYTISGDGTGIGIYVGSDTDARIRNLTLENFETGISTRNLDIDFEISLENISVVNNNRGIDGDRKQEISIKSSIISDNSTGISGSEGCNISINQSDLNRNDNIAVAGGTASWVELEDSSVRDNGSGISSGEGTFVDSIISDNDGYGIELIGLVASADLGDTTIVGNTIQNNAGTGINFLYSNGTVRENVIANNNNGVIISYDQVYAFNSPNHEFIDNTIEDNDEFGIQNTKNDLPSDVDTTAVATCNYWGDPTGPQHEDNPVEDPRGDKVSDDVEFVPWSVTDVVDNEATCIGGKTIGDFQDPPTDPDGDGLYEDINGDGESDIVDVQALFSNMDDDTIRNDPDAFDFNDDGSVDVIDVQKLFNEVSTN